MRPPGFADFKRKQLTLELRYPPAYWLWEAGGALCSELESAFSGFEVREATPAALQLTAGGRFNMRVSLESAVITDHEFGSTAQPTTEMLDRFVVTVRENLHLTSLKRVGTRVQFSLKSKDEEESRTILRSYELVHVPRERLFDIDPISLTPAYKIDVSDGELGYIAQLYAQTRKFEFMPPPEASDLINEPLERTRCEIILDLDFYTAKPVPADGFDAKAWLTRWLKVMKRDAPSILKASVTGL